MIIDKIQMDTRGQREVLLVSVDGWVFNWQRGTVPAWAVGGVTCGMVTHTPGHQPYTCKCSAGGHVGRLDILFQAQSGRVGIQIQSSAKHEHVQVSPFISHCFQFPSNWKIFTQKLCK